RRRGRIQWLERAPGLLHISEPKAARSRRLARPWHAKGRALQAGAHPDRPSEFSRPELADRREKVARSSPRRSEKGPQASRARGEEPRIQHLSTSRKADPTHPREWRCLSVEAPDQAWEDLLQDQQGSPAGGQNPG